MLRKVKVRLPQAQSGLEVKMKAGLGFNANQLSWPVMAGRFSEPDLEERQVLGPTDWDNANLEAELGETAVTDLNNDGIPEQYKIGGKRHYDGGTPLNLPENSFIFSRDITMKVKDPEILEQFGITNAPKGGITFADIAKKFNINKYKKILLDKNSDNLARETAELMIVNYNLKLGKLAIIQESIKGFPDGMPMIAMPYLESVKLDPSYFLPNQEEMLVTEDVAEENMQQGEPEEPDADMEQARYGRSFFQNGGGKGEVAEWKVIYVQSLGKPMFVGTDANGNVVATQSNNPNTSDKRTAEQIYNSKQKPKGSKQPAGSNKRTPIPLATKKEGWNDLHFDARLGENAGAYIQLADMITNNDKLQKALVTNFRARVEKSSLPASEKEAFKNLTQEQVVKRFLDYQKQVYALDEYQRLNPGVINPKWDGDNSHYRNTMKEIGFNDNEIFDDIGIKEAQATFAGMVDVANSADFEDVKGLGVFKKDMKGPKQKTTYDKDNPFMSDIDAFFGDNTARQFTAYSPEQKEKEKEKTSGTTAKTIDDDEIEVDEIEGETVSNMKAPWWLQDVIQFTGDWMDYSKIKKYLPWQAFPSVDFIEPTFYSPDRELAANAEQLAIGSEGLSNFTSPEAYTSRFSALAGQASQNAADIMARYNNLNVGVANEAEKFNTDIYNTYAAQRAQGTTELYDKLTVANQQYDNSKTAAKQKMRQSYINAITNSRQTAAMNTLYPNFALDAPSGGLPMFTGSIGDIQAIRESERDSKKKAFDEILKAYPGIDYNTAARMAGYNEKSMSNTPPFWGYPGNYSRVNQDEEEE